jgi:hypothetical protein
MKLIIKILIVSWDYWLLHDWNVISRMCFFFVSSWIVLLLIQVVRKGETIDVNFFSS